MDNKQSSVEWFAIESWKLRIELEGGKISMGEYANKYYQLKEQAKEMHKEETVNFALKYTFGKHKLDNNDLKINCQKLYNESFGGNNEKQ